MHKQKIFDNDSDRIFKKKKLLYKAMAAKDIESIDKLAGVIGKTKTSIYNCINYLPYREYKSPCFPTAEAIGLVLGWGELDVKHWYNGFLKGR